MTTKAEKAEAWESVLESLRECGEGGSCTLVITLLESNPSYSGIAQYFEVRVWGIGRSGGPEPQAWLTRLLARAMGYRFNEKREAISMGGYGYCRATQVVSDLHRKCGFPFRVQSINFFAGPTGWFPQAPEAQRKAG